MTLAEGIDVSAHQLTTPSLRGMAFLAARATYGTSADGMYRKHIAAARAAGLVTMAYHFNVPDAAATGAQQARAFIAAAGDVDLYAFDYEKERSRALMTPAGVREFIATFKALTGKKIGLYHSLSGFPSLGQNWNWVAAWRLSPPSIPWQFWQYQGSPLDRDRFHGDVTALRTFAGHPLLFAPVPTPPVVRRMRAAAGTYDTYKLTGGVASKAGTIRTGGFSATCVWLTAHYGTGTIALIRITSGVYKGKLLHRKARGISAP